MGSSSSLRVRLTISVLAIVVVSLLTAAVVGLMAFDAMVKQQAQRVVDANMSVASGLLTDRLASLAAATTAAAEDPMLSEKESPTPGELSTQLAHRAQASGLTYLAVVAKDGRIVASNLGTRQFTTTWPQLAAWATQPVSLSSVEIVPDQELVDIGAQSGLVQVKETPNGTIVKGEEAGSLSLTAVAPFRDGVLVGVRVMKLDFSLVDSVVEKVAGTATVFQHGVRIATTVRNTEGQRAVGTVVSDEVRKATLEGGDEFRGEAFVVNKLYLTAYQPLKNAAGQIIGMLYVGVDNAPYAAATRNFAFTFGGVVLLAALAGFVGAVNVSKTVSRPLAAVNAAADTVSTGDLTVQVPSTGYREVRQLAGSFNAMTGGLKGIIEQVEGSVAQLHAVSSQISSTSHSSAEYVTKQASSVAQTTATLEELTRSFQAVADGARHVLNLAEDALESAQEGVQTVDRSYAAMDQAAAGANDMANAASAMNEMADGITEMTSIITGIAEQTKILALNAAIEAARAGQAGKGFAVVSTEIRALADSVGLSADRISHLVADIQEASSRMQQAAHNQASLTESTVSISEDSRRAFSSIVQQMEDTTVAAREIAEATVQQTRASDQIVSAMHELSVSSNEAVGAARELAESATVVEAEAERMRSGLTRFKTS